MGRGGFLWTGWLNFNENFTAYAVMNFLVPVKFLALYPKAFKSYPPKSISENAYLWKKKSVRIVSHFMGRSTLMLYHEDPK